VLGFYSLSFSTINQRFASRHSIGGILAYKIRQLAQFSNFKHALQKYFEVLVVSSPVYKF